MGSDPYAAVNRSAWAERSTLRWFARFEGWSDLGEQRAIELIAEKVRRTAILDLGVGAGRTTPMLRALSNDYVAVDFMPEMVGLCRSKYPGVRVEQMDARDLSAFASESFGLVVFSWNGIDAVGHDDRQAILAEVYRVLKPDGIFMFSTHNKLGPGYEEKPWLLRPRDVRHPRHFITQVISLRGNLRNHRRLMDLSDDHGDWSMMNAAAHHYGIVIHYVTPDRQLRDLVAVGFRHDPVVFSNKGVRILPGDDTGQAWWLHFLATKD